MPWTTDNEYLYCRVCWKTLDEDTAKRAQRLFERQACSTECLQKERKQRYAC